MYFIPLRFLYFRPEWKMSGQSAILLRERLPRAESKGCTGTFVGLSVATTFDVEVKLALFISRSLVLGIEPSCVGHSSFHPYEASLALSSLPANTKPTPMTRRWDFVFIVSLLASFYSPSRKCWGFEPSCIGCSCRVR